MFKCDVVNHVAHTQSDWNLSEEKLLIFLKP